MGKNEGSQLEGAVVVGTGELVDVEEVWSSVPVGLAFTGRSGWSVGLAIRLVAVDTGAMVVVAPAIVVVAIISS